MFPSFAGKIFKVNYLWANPPRVADYQRQYLKDAGRKMTFSSLDGRYRQFDELDSKLRKKFPAFAGKMPAKKMGSESSPSSLSLPSLELSDTQSL